MKGTEQIGMGIKNLKKYRNELVGFGILWVFLFHARLLNLPLLNYIKLIGYGGVDICLFFSGFGIYHSLKKEHRTMVFYKKRLVRIFPEYILTVGIYSVIMVCIGEQSIGDIFLNITTLFYYVSPEMTFNWYIPALIVLYAISPLYYYIFNEKLKTSKGKIVLTLMVCIGSLLLGLIQYKIGIERYMSLTTRIPIYFIGMLFAFILSDSKLLSKANSVKGICAGVIPFLIGNIILYMSISSGSNEILGKLGMYWYPFILIIPTFCVILSSVLYYMEKRSIGHIIIRFLRYNGKHSLMLYLISVSMNMIAPFMISGDWVKIHSWLYNVVFVLIVYILNGIYVKFKGIFVK